MTPLAGVIIGYLFGSRDVSGDKKSLPGTRLPRRALEMTGRVPKTLRIATRRKSARASEATPRLAQPTGGGPFPHKP